MVHVDDDSDPGPRPGPLLGSGERRNDVHRALRFMLAKAHCRGHALSCFIDDEPTEPLPAQAPHDNAATGELVVNSSLRYEPRGEAPLEIRQRVLFMDGLLRGVPLAWIEDSGTGLWVPSWIRDKWDAILASLRPGTPAPATLTRRERQTLARARVLVRPGAERERLATWNRICVDAGAQFRRHGYAIVRDLIPPLLRAGLQRYYRELVAGGRLPRGDNQVAERYRLHSEPVAMFLHPQLTSLVSRLAGERAKPSYLYFASYPPGSALPRHIDRVQCEFSISLLTDYTPVPSGRCGWPLFLEHPGLPNGVAAADLGIGDALFYRGRELVHYRHPLAEGHQSSSIFLHYVREDFVGDTQ